ncbi:MAG: MAC/perforin domain-containing protein [Myxococcota bacterium]
MKLRVALAIGLLLQASAADAQDQPEPIVFDGRSTLSLAPHEDMERGGDEGSVDAWLAALWQSDPGYDPCLVAMRKPPAGEGRSAAARATRFSVHIGAGRDRIGLSNGRSTAWLPFDFSDGEYHHVALATRGPSTEVVVDGQPLGALPIGFGAGRDVPLQLGSADGQSDFFLGAVLSVRLWNKALSSDDLADLAELTGAPRAGSPLARRLVAWAEFTTSDRELHLASDAPPRARPATAAKPAATAPAGAGAETSDGVPLVAPDFDLAGVWVKQNSRVFEKESDPELPDDEHGRYRSFPVFVVEQRDPEQVTLDSASFGPGGGRDFLDEVSDGGRASELRIETRDGVDSIQLVVETARGQRRERPRRGAHRSGSTRHVFTLQADENIVAVSGSQDEKRITSLQIHTSRRSSEIFGNETNERFDIDLPEGAALSGIAGSAGRELTRLALRFLGRAPALELLLDDGSTRTFMPTGPRGYAEGKSDLVVLDGDRFTLDGVPFERVPPYAEIEGKSTYGDVFAIANQLYNVEYSFRTYDITRLDPFDYKLFGVGQFVFQFPDEGSTDWYVRNKAMIPYGVEFVTRDTGGTKQSTEIASSESTYQKALSRGLSIEAGIGPKGGMQPVSFSRNETYKQSVQHMYGSESSYTFGEAKMEAYALVLDRARVKLDERFRRRVMELKENRNYKGFLESYGTHYPHAVTYGGRGVLTMEMDKTTFSKMMSQGVDIATNANIALKFISAGGGVTEGSEVSDSFREEMSSQFDSFRWVGGSAGFGKESWQVGDKVTPVFLDLRPIEALLGAPFFSDPEVIGKVRQGLAQEIARYLTSAPKPREESVAPETYMVEVERLELVRAGEADRKAELTGTIAIKGYDSRGRTELPGEAEVWKQGKKQPLEVRDGTSHLLADQGRPVRRVFAVGDDAKGGYAVIEAKLREQDTGIEAVGGGEADDLGTVRSNKIYWRSMRASPGSTGSVRVRATNCGMSCAELRVHYRYLKQ